MYCPKCGAEITHYSKYCRKCGTKLPYNNEFEKDNSDSDGEGNFFTANRQIIILSILGLAIIIMLSAFAIGPSNHENSSSADSSFDDFINNNLVSSSDDSEDVEYYYTSGGYDFSRNSNNEDSKLSDISNTFFSNDFFNRSL